MSAASRVRQDLEEIHRAALAAVDAGDAVRRVIQRSDAALEIIGERIDAGAGLRVLAAGKAAAPMASGLLDVAGDRVRGGLVVTKDGHAAGHALARLEQIEASHPVPDARGERAARAAIDLVSRCDEADVLVFLLSGGASALLSAPVHGISQEALAEVNQLLLLGGADIVETNAVRKHLSRVSGGRLAQRASASRILVLAVSDVPGDRPDVIGSGPFSPDPSSFADAIAVMKRRRIWSRAPEPVRAHLERGAAGAEEETAGGADACFERVRYAVVANNQDARRAACGAARARGWRACDIGEVLRGEACVAAERLVAIAGAIDCDEPTCLVAGGETSVTVRGSGRGGRSQELALASAAAMAGDDAGAAPEVVLLAAGTDGSDGPTPAAGAWADPGTVGRGRERGVSAREALDDNDAYGFFSREGGLFETGPTGTNVMDLVLLAVGHPASSAP